jgi:hypothetical protein
MKKPSKKQGKTVMKPIITEHFLTKIDFENGKNGDVLILKTFDYGEYCFILTDKKNNEIRYFPFKLYLKYADQKNVVKFTNEENAEAIIKSFNINILAKIEPFEDKYRIVDKSNMNPKLQGSDFYLVSLAHIRSAINVVCDDPDERPSRKTMLRDILSQIALCKSKK